VRGVIQAFAIGMDFTAMLPDTKELGARSCLEHWASRPSLKALAGQPHHLAGNHGRRVLVLSSD